MSQNLGFILRRKKNPEVEVRLDYFGSTISKTLSSKNCLPYTDEVIEVTDEMISKTLGALNKLITQTNVWLNGKQIERRNIEGLISRCNSREAVLGLVSKIGDIDSEIFQIKEETCELREYLDTIKSCIRIAECNSD